MWPRVLPCALLAAAAAGSAHADVTLRQSIEYQSRLAPPDSPGGVVATFDGPMEMVVRLKNGRAGFAFGSFAVITDSAKKQVTLLDTAQHRFATATLADYLAQRAAGAGETSSGPDVQIKVDSHATGKSEEILGIAAEQSEIGLSLLFPMAVAGAPSGPGGLEVAGTLEAWKPASGETQRIPALRELADYYKVSEPQGFGPAVMLNELFSRMPGLGGHMGALADELNRGGNLVLRLHGAFFMPGIAAILEQAQANGANLPDLPGIATPLFEITLDVLKLDGRPVAPSGLEVPAGYQPAPLGELLKSFTAAGLKR